MCSSPVTSNIWERLTKITTTFFPQMHLQNSKYSSMLPLTARYRVTQILICLFLFPLNLLYKGRGHLLQDNVLSLHLNQKERSTDFLCNNGSCSSAEATTVSESQQMLTTGHSWQVTTTFFMLNLLLRVLSNTVTVELLLIATSLPFVCHLKRLLDYTQLPQTYKVNFLVIPNKPHRN